MDATSNSTDYSTSRASALDTTGAPSGQNASSELEDVFNALMRMSKGDGSAELGGNKDGATARDLERVLQSLLNVLDDGQGGASPSGPSASDGPGSGATAGSGGAGAPDTGAPGMGAGNAPGAAGGGVPTQPAGAPGGTNPGSATSGSTDTSPGTGGALSSMPTESVQPSNPSQVTNSDMSAGKTQVYDALKQQGATPQEIAMVMGSGMVETNDFNADQRDASKDGTASENYSAFNLNEPELQKLGYTGDPSALNNQNNIGQVADLLLNGMRKDGFNDVAGMTRDSVNFDPDSSDIQQWDAERSADANKLLQLYQQEGTQAFTDNERVASYSQHI